MAAGDRVHHRLQLVGQGGAGLTGGDPAARSGQPVFDGQAKRVAVQRHRRAGIGAAVAGRGQSQRHAGDDVVPEGDRVLDGVEHAVGPSLAGDPAGEPIQAAVQQSFRPAGLGQDRRHGDRGLGLSLRLGPVQPGFDLNGRPGAGGQHPGDAVGPLDQPHRGLKGV